MFYRCVLLQAMYHFLSGYTAKVAGTERGVTEPTPNFSAGFGAAFLTLHPTKWVEVVCSTVSRETSTREEKFERMKSPDLHKSSVVYVFPLCM